MIKNSLFVFLFLLALLLQMTYCSTNPTGVVDDNSTTVTDIDGNVYSTVKIGNQLWTAENLRTTRYNDGVPIEKDTLKATWNAATTPKYCYYRNTMNEDSIRKFGALYNWHVVNSKKLAPVGWHVPTDDDWGKLQSYLISNGYNWDGTNTENRIAKALAAKTDWYGDTGVGSIGNNLSTNNRSGFTALPGGLRYMDGPFYNGGFYGLWWSATAENSSHAYGRGLYCGGKNLVSGSYYKSTGFSIRILRN